MKNLAVTLFTIVSFVAPKLFKRGVDVSNNRKTGIKRGFDTIFGLISNPINPNSQSKSRIAKAIQPYELKFSSKKYIFKTVHISIHFEPDSFASNPISFGLAFSLLENAPTLENGIPVIPHFKKPTSHLFNLVPTGSICNAWIKKSSQVRHPTRTPNPGSQTLAFCHQSARSGNTIHSKTDDSSPLDIHPIPASPNRPKAKAA